jgi:hypothetical protein
MEEKKEECCKDKGSCCSDGCGCGCRCGRGVILILVFLVGGIIGYLMGHGCGMCRKKMMGPPCPMMGQVATPPAK